SLKKTICSYYKANGHNSDRCWKLHPELQPKEEKGKKEKCALAAAIMDLLDLDKPNPKLTIIFKQPLAIDEASRKELFYVSIQAKQSLVEAIIDPGSQYNLISEAVVK
ncbi:hypothetical protein GIB67_031432, partial [Kingdonia uniflora]